MIQRKIFNNIKYRQIVNIFEIKFLIFKSLYIKKNSYSKLIKIKCNDFNKKVISYLILFLTI
jgi:hypothetical protein